MVESNREDDVGHAPDIEGNWLRPSSTWPAEPRWGFADGLQVAIAPVPGPRGLLRIFAPYLGLTQLLNFVAVEPIPAGAVERGYSELERSSMDDQPGKRFWTSDDLSGPASPDPAHPARGVISHHEGVERLTVFVIVEPFDNGAEVAVRLSFRADRPHEIALSPIRLPGSVPLTACVLSATMGNFARLRKLQLADRAVAPIDLWPGFTGVDFTNHARFGVGELTRDQDGAMVSATPDEVDLTAVTYSDDTHEHWKYRGARAIQQWRAPDPSPDLEVLVNARWAYWASSSPIPGGPAFENFEFFEPYRDGIEYIFSVEPMEG